MRLPTLLFFCLLAGTVQLETVLAAGSEETEITYSIPRLLERAAKAERDSLQQGGNGRAAEDARKNALSLYRLLDGILANSPTLETGLRKVAFRRTGWYFYRNAKDDRDREMGRDLLWRALEIAKDDPLTTYCLLVLQYDRAEALRTKVSGDTLWKLFHSTAEGLNSLLKRKPNFPEAYFLLSRCCGQTHRFDQMEAAALSMRDTLESFTPELNGFDVGYPSTSLTIALPDGTHLKRFELPDR